MEVRYLFICLIVAAAVSSAEASESNDSAPTLLSTYCVDCHGEDTQEANVRLDTLLDHVTPTDGELLLRVLQVLKSGEMPPEGADELSSSERSALTSWIENQLPSLRQAARAQRPTRTRRLTVEEYNYAMQNLFGVNARFDDLLPDDPISESGYRNASEQLGLTTIQMESYLESARRAVNRYVRFGPLAAEPIRYHVKLRDLNYSTAKRYETLQRAPKPLGAGEFDRLRKARSASAPDYIAPLGPALPGAFSDEEAFRAAIPKLNEQYIALPERLRVGEMIVRVRAAGTADRDGRYPRMRVQAGISLGDGCSVDKRVLGETDVTASRETPKSYTFRVRLEDVPTKGPLREDESFDRLSVFDMDQIFISNVSPDPQAVFDLGRGAYRDAETASMATADAMQRMTDANVNFLYLDSVEIEILPGTGPSNHPYRWTVTVQEDANEAEWSSIARELLNRFMPQVYRRPVADDEIANKMKLFQSIRRQGFSFEESLRETLVACLVSPSFLFLQWEPPETSSSDSERAYRLASRLSFLIWLSPPDDELRQCAADRSLLQPEVLERQANRMLDDPRSRRFLDSFCRQWLRLDRHAKVSVDRHAFPSYDQDLADAAVKESLETFAANFHARGSALDLIDSDDAMLNDRLAQHYDLPVVPSGEFQRVRLPHDSARGGLLTQASVLTMKSYGVDSHPIRRGVWLLDRILHDPPPPPPPEVPQLDPSDPDFRGLSLKERIELHRQPSSCLNCHQGIDPWGIAFENFDATGRWRETVRGEIDSATTLPDGARIDHIVELKRYLRQQRSDEFARSLVLHMITYAIGRAPDFADEPEVEEIYDDFVASGHQLRALVLAIVSHPLVQEQTLSKSHE